jgi:hypothetical protein
MDAEESELKNNEPKSVPPRKNGGRRPGAGRKKGVPNKLTANVKTRIMAAFADAGGKDYLVKVAKTDPRTFCALHGKILPTQVTGDAAEPVKISRPGGFDAFQTNPRWRKAVRDPTETSGTPRDCSAAFSLAPAVDADMPLTAHARAGKTKEPSARIPEIFS